MFQSFPSIEQLRNVVQEVNHLTAGAAIELEFTGTVKLHGTNSAVGWDPATEKLWAQSRTGIVTATKDNCGFAKYVERPEVTAYFKNILCEISDQPVIVYGEWCGNGVQKGVAISQVPRRFVAFAVRTKTKDSDSDWIWLSDDYVRRFSSPEHSVWNVMELSKPEWHLLINFSEEGLAAAQRQLVAWTDEVERECPAGKAFGVSGVGEGIVWTCQSHGVDPRFNLLRFKIKGNKHSVAAMNNAVSPEVVGLNEFVLAVVTQARLEQAMHYVFEIELHGEVPSVGRIAKFLKWMVSDVLKEEADTIKLNNFSEKDLTREISAAARKWFLQSI